MKVLVAIVSLSALLMLSACEEVPAATTATPVSAQNSQTAQANSDGWAETPWQDSGWNDAGTSTGSALPVAADNTSTQLTPDTGWNDGTGTQTAWPVAEGSSTSEDDSDWAE